MKAIVHIGSPKVGSSSIQSFLFDNHKALAKQGFRFHRNVSGRGSQYEYAMAAMVRAGKLLPGETERIRYSARSLEEARGETERFVRELARYPSTWKEPVAIFSSEHILPWLNGPTMAETFHAMFADVFTEVRYIVYFRSQLDAIVSQYSERTKRGYSFTLDEFILRRLKGQNIFKPARRWANAVGKQNLDVRLLDKSFLKNGDLIDDFCFACGIDPTGLQRPERVNESLSAPGAECLRVLNQVIPEIHPDGGHNPLRSEILSTVIELSSDMPKLVLNPQQRAVVEAEIEKSNEKLRKQFLPTRDVLFPNRKTDAVALSQEDLRGMALDLMAQLLIKTRMGDIRALSALERKRAFVATPQANPETPQPTGATPATNDTPIAGTRIH